MNYLARFIITLPITFPLLALATFLDFATSPISHKMKTDWPEEIAEVAFDIMGV